MIKQKKDDKQSDSKIGKYDKTEHYMIKHSYRKIDNKVMDQHNKWCRRTEG